VATLATVDRFGRIVIPKQSRDHFGLAPGASVTVVDGEEGILLKPGAPEAPLVLKGRVLVFSGAAAGEGEALVQRLREERIRRFIPRRTR
jgi:AbrB family looped-hinge helix DNA binding protein